MTNYVLSHALIGTVLILSVFASGCASSPVTTTTMPTTTTESNLMITIYCVSNACATQQVQAGAGTLIQGCFRSQSECTAAIAGTVTTTVQSPQNHAITIQNFAFSPATLTIPAGSTVTWTNQDSAPHTLTPDTTTTGFGSSTLSQGQTYSYTFTQAGSFPYHCSIHTSMHGTIIVQ